MTRSEKIRLVVGLILLAAGLIWPVPANDRSFGQSFIGMVIVPVMLWISLICLIGPVAVSRRREIWSWLHDFCLGKSSHAH